MSTSAVAALVVNVRFVAPDGTVMKKYFQVFRATDWPVSVWPDVSCVSPPPHVAVKFLPVAFGPTVTDCEVGENVQPDFDGVTVYVPAVRPESV